MPLKQSESGSAKKGGRPSSCRGSLVWRNWHALQTLKIVCDAAIYCKVVLMHCGFTLNSMQPGRSLPGRFIALD